jgi:hypothetical protein
MNFISGYEFYKIAKWSFCPRYPIKLELNNIEENDIIFLNLDYFERFLEILINYKPKNKFILITHNSDKKFDEYYYNKINKYITHLYSINCIIQKENIIPIPLGFVDDKYKPHYKFELINNKIKNILIYMNFSINTNPIKRNECWNIFQDKKWIIKESNLEPQDFYERISKSKYVLLTRRYRYRLS